MSCLDCSLLRRPHEGPLEWSPRPLPTSRAQRLRHSCASAPPPLLQLLTAGAPRGLPEALRGASKPAVRLPLPRPTQGAKAAQHIASLATMPTLRFQDRRATSSVSCSDVQSVAVDRLGFAVSMFVGRRITRVRQDHAHLVLARPSMARGRLRDLGSHAEDVLHDPRRGAGARVHKDDLAQRVVGDVLERVGVLKEQQEVRVDAGRA